MTVVLLVLAGMLVILGPRNVLRRAARVRRPNKIASLFETRSTNDVLPPGLHPKTQRVLMAAARLATWLRGHGQEEAARDLRSAAARMTGNEAAGLYALQTTLRRMRVVNVSDRASQERLRALVNELRNALQDRFEQLELLPFRRP